MLAKRVRGRVFIKKTKNQQSRGSDDSDDDGGVDNDTTSNGKDNDG